MRTDRTTGSPAKLLAADASIIALCALFFLISCGSTLASANSKIEIEYRVTYLSVTVGSAEWQLLLNGDHYEISASARIKGMMSVLLDGEGAGSARGVISKGHSVPSELVAHVLSPEETDNIRITLQGGTVTSLVALPPLPPLPPRIPVTADLLRKVIDPLSAVIFSNDGSTENALDACRRRLPIFDGRRRYDVDLFFKRTETLSLPNDFDGAVIVCALQLTPIAGQQVESSAFDFLIKSKDIEIWFARLSAARLFVPVGARVPTLIGTLHVNPQNIDVETDRSRVVAPDNHGQ